MNCKNEIIKIIAEISKIKESEFDLNTKIYDSKIISSLQLLDIMNKLEKKFNIIIEPEELIPDNFTDIKAIVKFIELK